MSPNIFPPNAFVLAVNRFLVCTNHVSKFVLPGETAKPPILDPTTVAILGTIVSTFFQLWGLEA